LWYLKVADAMAHAKHHSRVHDAVIHIYDKAGKEIELHRHKGDFKERIFVFDCRTANDPAMMPSTNYTL
jgi:hypothetical protein